MNSKALILFLGFLFAVGLAISSATETQDEKQVDGLEGKSQIDDELQGTEAMPEKADTTDIANHHGGHGGHGGSGGGGKGSGGSGGSGGGKGGGGTGGGSGGGGSEGGGKGGSSLPQKKPKTKFRNQSISL